MTLDHMKLVNRQPRELKKLRRCLLGAQRGEVLDLAVEHEHDGSCCDREPWPVTIRITVAALESKALYVALVPDAER
jgi:hypothetical protein